jgi:two-component system, OmpR family, phosphate regulon response regulator PhoB
MYPAPRTVTRIGISGCSTVADALRNIVFRFDGSPAFALALAEGDQELALPSGETVADGEWVLAMFEVGVRGDRHRATASAARGLVRGSGDPPVLAFERRDWERLVDFAEAGSMRMLEAAKVLSEPLPAARPVAPSLHAAPAASVPYARILVVDDEREVCEIVSAMLEAVGLAVDAVGSAEDALERIRGAGERVDLVILAWTLPGMNGIELCRVLRKDPAHAMLPVLVLSGRSSTQDVVDAFASGADDYVSKPFRAPELGARIFSLLRRARMVPATAV